MENSVNSVKETSIESVAAQLNAELADVEHAEDDGHHYAIIWTI